MSCTTTDGCDGPDFVGYISSHPPSEMATAGPMMSTYTCGTTTCMNAQRRRVKDATGLDGEFYEFTTTQARASKGGQDEVD